MANAERKPQITIIKQPEDNSGEIRREWKVIKDGEVKELKYDSGNKAKPNKHSLRGGK